MSAFVVDETHIALLVHAIMEGPSQYHGGPGNSWSLPRYLESDYGACFFPYGAPDPDKLGALLLAENIRSVEHRYPNEPANELPGPIPTPEAECFTYRRPRYQLTAVETLAAIACWRYQTCETPDHANTPAWQLLDRLEGAMIRCLPGYSAAPWCWSDTTITERIARRA